MRLENIIASEIMHISRRLFQRGARTMESMNIGVGQVPILELLKTNGTMTQRQIAEEIRVTPATICGTIKRMERTGLIRRTSMESDGRVTCISLTETGETLTEQARKAIEHARRNLLDGFSEEECAQLHSFIIRISENLTHTAQSENEELTQ